MFSAWAGPENWEQFGLVVLSRVHPDSNMLYPVLLGTGGNAKPASQETAWCSCDANSTIYISSEQALLAEELFFFKSFSSVYSMAMTYCKLWTYEGVEFNMFVFASLFAWLHLTNLHIIQWNLAYFLFSIHQFCFQDLGQKGNLKIFSFKVFLQFEERTTSISGIFALMYICLCVYCLYSICMLNQVCPSGVSFIFHLFLDYSCGYTRTCGPIFEKNLVL